MNASKSPLRESDPLTEKAEVSTRAKLISAAKKLFADKGFSATSVKDLAELAQVNVSLVSYHFGGKEGLYAECIEEFGRNRLKTAQNLLDIADTKEEFAVRLRLFAEDFLRVHEEDPEVTQILHREMLCDNPTIKLVFERTFLKAFQQLCDFIAAGQKRHYLREDLDPILSSSQFFGAILHVARHAKQMQDYFGKSLSDPEYRKHLCEHQVRSFLYGISSATNEKEKT